MVRAVPVGRQGATKIGGGKRGDLVGHTHLHGGVVKRRHGGTDPAEQPTMVAQQVVMQVKSAQRDQKDLAPRAQTGLPLDQPGDHFHLEPKAVGGEHGGGGGPRQRCGDGSLSGNGPARDGVVFVFQFLRPRLLNQRMECVAHRARTIDSRGGWRDLDGAAGAELVLQRRVPGQENRIAGD